MQQARKHLERGGLAGAVGAQEADDLAGRQVEGDAVHGGDFLGLAMHQALERGQHAGFALADDVGLMQVADVDGGGHGNFRFLILDFRLKRHSKGASQHGGLLTGRYDAGFPSCLGDMRNP